jgi:hypothetical protein
MEASSRNSVPNPSEEEKTTLISVLWNKNKSQLSIPNHFVEKIVLEKANFEEWTNHFVKLP